MAVQFILGKNPNTKRIQLIDKMYSILKSEPNANIIYLVPDNVKYEAEMLILKEFKEKEPASKYSGMIRLQVFSFSRLAWYLLQNKPIYQRPQLTEIGLSMLVKKILQEEEENLTIYRGSSHQTGFVERLVTLFSELRNGRITPEDLLEMSNNEKIASVLGSEDFKRKISDLTHLYKMYDKSLKGKYIEREDLFHELTKHLKHHKELLENTYVFIDHYEHFSAQELNLLVNLGKYAKQLYINLTLDAPFILLNNDLNNMFYRTNKTYQTLKVEFMKQHLTINDDIILEPDKRNDKDNHSKDVTLLSQYWVESSGPTTWKTLEKYKNKALEDIEIWAAEDHSTEVMHIANNIRKIVASGKYRYNDIQIMTRDLESCILNIERAFVENGIPFFIDQADSMAQHPLLEFITSLFAIKKNHYRLNDVMRLLRTELFVPSTSKEGTENANITWREQIDITENVALAYGMKGNDWIQDEDWQYVRFNLDEEYKQTEAEIQIQETANYVRGIFKNSIVPFLDSLTEELTNIEFSKKLYQFLLDIGVINQLQTWRDELVETGELAEAREHEQAWDTFISLLDEFVEILGDEIWDLDAFISIIETGFEQATFGMVPPSIDQVLVTNFDLPKIQPKKVVFLIGLTDSNLPQFHGNRSLLTDEDREIIEQSLSSDKYLAVSEVESVANEPFTFFLALQQATDKIIFSYPMSNSDNGENKVSPYLSRIQNVFSIDTQFKYATAVAGQHEKIDYTDFIGSISHTFGHMLINIRSALDQRIEPDLFWLNMYAELYNPANSRLRKIMNSLYHKNIPTPLTEDLAEELYGKDLYLSVSQLETFNADPYSHFLLYGLRLRERQIQELSPLESGNFYHDALDIISRQLLMYKKDLSEISEKELQNVMTDVFNLLIDSNKYRLSRSSKRMEFIFRQLSNTVGNLVKSILSQSKRSKYRINKTELVFGQLGQSSDVRGLYFDLANGRKLQLRGKVDRVDTFKQGNQLYAGIVDYKSSDTTFNYENIYYGLMLQMITYLDTVLTFSEDIFEEKAKGIGAFYSTVKNNYIDLNKVGNKKLEAERLKTYKFDGLIVDQRDVLEAADTVLDLKENSPLYNLYLNKDGLYTGKKILTEEEFNLLIQYNRTKIIEAGEKILSGVIHLSPFDHNKIRVHTPSITGPYRAISQFDALLPENNYRQVNKMDKETFFDYLRTLYQ